MKKYIAISITLLISVLSGCSRSKPDVFMAWTDGYMAMGRTEKVTADLTMYYEKRKVPFKPEEVINADLDFNAEGVGVSSYEVENGESYENGKYRSYIFHITFHAQEQGSFEAQNLLITTQNANKADSEIKYPIGKWIFDIGEDEEAGLIDTWSSPGALSGDNKFSYDYTIKEKGTKIKSIQYAIDSKIEDSTGVPVSGSADLPDGKAPVRYIRTAITLDQKGQEKIAYGKGCYCLVMKNDIEKSRELAAGAENK